jgi:AcrR family transcriptional regulator
MVDSPNVDRSARRRESTRREILDAAWEVARESGLTGFTLRDVAARVGMRAPSLYSHFDSKHAIYDAMYGEAWADYERVKQVDEAEAPGDLRGAAQAMSRTFFEFAVADHARYQLMNERVVPGFEPTPESYAPAVRVLESTYAMAADRGLADRDDLTILLAIIGGLIAQHLANDPGGDRYARLLPRAVDMWADGLGLPRATTPDKDTP